MNSSIALKKLNLLFVDDDISTTADAYGLFVSMFNSVLLAHDAVHAKHLFDTHKIDLIMTDIKMPGSDGLTFVKKVREYHAEVPIVILSAFSDYDYLLRAANLRIDGYLIKPLSFKKLSPVFKRIAERLKYKISNYSISSNIQFDINSGTLLIDGASVRLGKKEQALLTLLIEHSPSIVSKALIKNALQVDEEISESALKNLLGELRRKLSYKVIENIPTKGWRLKIPVSNLD
ncbi:MAG: two-component system response regulator VanR [Pseudohongiellaceae bacterium]|jgi:two-component system response regulator VanR